MLDENKNGYSEIPRDIDKKENVFQFDYSNFIYSTSTPITDAGD